MERLLIPINLSGDKTVTFDVNKRIGLGLVWRLMFIDDSIQGSAGNMGRYAHMAYEIMRNKMVQDALEYVGDPDVYCNTIFNLR